MMNSATSKLVRTCFQGLTRLSILATFFLPTVDLQQAEDCTGDECQTSCQCPQSESPPCSVIGLAIANVLVAFPLLVVYLFFPVCCCIYSCRDRSKDMDKPPQIEQAPPQFPRMDTLTYTHNIDDSEDETNLEEDTVFDEENNVKRNNQIVNKPKKLKKSISFDIPEDASLDVNSLLDFKETCPPTGPIFPN